MVPSTCICLKNRDDVGNALICLANHKKWPGFVHFIIHFAVPFLSFLLHFLRHRKHKGHFTKLCATGSCRLAEQSYVSDDIFRETKTLGVYKSIGLLNLSKQNLKKHVLQYGFFVKLFMDKCFAQEHKCHDRDSDPH